MLRKICYYFGISHKNDFALLNFEKKMSKLTYFRQKTSFIKVAFWFLTKCNKQQQNGKCVAKGIVCHLSEWKEC